MVALVTSCGSQFTLTVEDGENLIRASRDAGEVLRSSVYGIQRIISGDGWKLVGSIYSDAFDGLVWWARH